jgi:hypothetical protein
MLTKIEQHLASCDQCFRFFMLRWSDVADDHGTCPAGRELLPILPPAGATIAIVHGEPEMDYENRTRTHALGR